MSTQNRYIPILKWKRAEQSALQTLEEKDRNAVIPLIELVMPTVSLYRTENKLGKKERIRKTDEERFAEIVIKFKEKRIQEIPEEILQTWGAKPIFLDFTLLFEEQRSTQLKIDSLNQIIPTSMDKGLKVIPVLNLNDDPKLKEAVSLLVRKNNQGVCLKIKASDLSDLSGTDTLNKKIAGFLADLNSVRKNIDLLIDIEEIKEKGGQYLHFMNASQKIGGLPEWRNFIFASGAFPKDLSGCRAENNPTFLPRFDWQNWAYHIKEGNLIRSPVFADYTIRNPIFSDILQYYNSTPSIKYTLENDWLIMRGEMHKSEQYLANAKLLTEDTNYFYGEGFSWGDKNIAKKAKYYHQYVGGINSGKFKKGKGTGSNTDWISWGINHHLISVINQIAKLSSAPTISF